MKIYEMKLPVAICLLPLYTTPLCFGELQVLLPGAKIPGQATPGGEMRLFHLKYAVFYAFVDLHGFNFKNQRERSQTNCF